MQRESFNAHALWRTIEQAEELATDADQWAQQPLTDHWLQTLRWIFSTLHSHDDPADTVPYSTTALDQLNNAAAQVVSALTQCESTKNATYLDNAAPYIESLLQQIPSLPSIANRDPARQASRTFAEYRTSMEESLAALRSRASEVEDALEASSTGMETRATQASAALQELRDQLDVLEERIAADETRLRQELTNTNETFNASQTERDSRFTEWLEKQEKEFSGRVRPFLDELTRLRASGAETLEEIDKLRDDTGKVAGLATGDVLSRRYNEYYRSQFVAGIAANLVGLIALAIGAVVILLAFRDIGPSEKVTWQFTTLKLGITFTIVAAAIVAFRLGAHFLEEARTSKKVGLELHAIGPFLAEVNDPNAIRDAKTAFITRTFAPSRATDPEDQLLPASAVERILTAAGRLVGR